VVLTLKFSRAASDKIKYKNSKCAIKVIIKHLQLLYEWYKKYNTEKQTFWINQQNIKNTTKNEMKLIYSTLWK